MKTLLRNLLAAAIAVPLALAASVASAEKIRIALAETPSRADVPFHVAGAMAVGVVLFVGSTAAAQYRVTRRVLWPRLIVAALVGGLLLVLAPASAALALGVTCAGLIAISAVEHYGPAAKPA